MANTKQNKKIGNTKHDKKTGKFIHNVVKLEDARAYAADYYDKHQNSIDKIMDGRTKRNKKDVFIDLVDDLFDQNRSKYTSKKSLNEGIRGIVNELQGIDPRLNEIKRDALNREEAGFSDLRKLNNPKKKKVKHLVIYNTVLTEFAEKLQGNENLDDAYVRRILSPFTKSVSKEMEVE